MKYLWWCLALLTIWSAPSRPARAQDVPFQEIPSPQPAPFDPVDPADLARFFQTRPLDNLLRVHLDSGRVAEGHLAGVSGDSLFLTPDEFPDATPTGIALLEVLLVEELRSGAERAGNWGTASGAVIGGALGLGLGLFAASMNQNDDARVALAVAGITVGGMALGAATLGVTGMLAGSMTHVWYRVYPGSGASMPSIPAATRPPGSAPGTRFNLMIGNGTVNGDEFTLDTLGARTSLTRRLGSLDMGPELGFYQLDSRPQAGSSPDGATSRQENVLQIGIGSIWQRQTPGLAPYAALGAGLYAWGDGFFGASVGGGLRWRSGGHHDIFLDGRYHFRLLGGQSNPESGFLTVGAGWAFDI